MTCAAITLPTPGPAPPGFPFSLPTIPIPNIDLEDLLDLFNRLQFLTPAGGFKPSLSINFSKDIFDAITSLLDQFMPFLMLYKFFLPVLNLIICIIEVLCALMNPFALIAALNRLFTVCIPAFLALFPIFALILLIISIIILLILLIEYLVAQIIIFVLLLLRNIAALVLAFAVSNATGVLAIAEKLANLLCFFQNLMVLLAFFGIIISIIKDILGMLFSIPPCEGGDNSACCNPQFCPEIVQNPYTRETGTLQYLNEVGVATTIQVPDGYFNVDLRTESWQLYDTQQTLQQQFWNIVDAYDVVADGYVSPVFFPTDTLYTATTVPAQVAYTVNLRLLYNPIIWGRAGTPHYIRFNNCVVLVAPTQAVQNADGTFAIEPTGVFFIAGGLGFLDDGKTPINGYASDGITPTKVQATLNSFLHLPPVFSASPVLSSVGEVVFSDMTYTFTPNLPVLLQKNLITLGCEPAVALSRAFVNNVLFSNVAVQTANLQAIVNSPDFPDPAGAQECIQTALSTLQTNMTNQGVADFQTSANLCLSDLQTNASNALGALVGAGFSPCNSSFSLTPSIQFTTMPIIITVNINENSGIPITSSLPANIGQQLAQQITAAPTFGSVGPFTYDGYQVFTAPLTSTTPGSGTVSIVFQNQVLCTNTLPTDGITPPSHTLQSKSYQFVYAPTSSGNLPPTGEDDTTGITPRRNINGGS